MEKKNVSDNTCSEESAAKEGATTLSLHVCQHMECMQVEITRAPHWLGRNVAEKRRRCI